MVSTSSEVFCGSLGNVSREGVSTGFVPESINFRFGNPCLPHPVRALNRIPVDPVADVAHKGDGCD